ncbi:probable membrane protein YPO3302 [hydrothermal vent metagenome]|uniref:Probable membrane protein YPO3302 n=1 Tax=hydrothermal vent metagenome TaxID=652676 RepID=A0A3B1E6R1_9ZZZZ
MAYLYLSLSAFISATLLPFGSEALLFYDLTINLNIYILLIVATVGNSLGSVLNYWLGLKGKVYLVDKNIIDKQKLILAKQYFEKYGGYSLLLSWLPIIGDPITFVAGIMKYSFKKFLILVAIAKASRYLFIILSYILY